MVDGNINFLRQFFLNFKAAGGRNVFEVEAGKGLLHVLQGTNHFIWGNLLNGQWNGIHSGQVLV